MDNPNQLMDEYCLSHICSVFTVFVLVNIPKIKASTIDDFTSLCNCDINCPESKVIGLQKKKRDELSRVNDGGINDDGNRTICGSDRDIGNRTFPSICHMMCYNNCTRYNSRKLVQDDKELVHLTASRDNFYKLHDGACQSI
ncbi:PREDICTED: uncharacterized protein LOC105363533 [Ceratosolen solmsi marchali]|uniref:Uncharacterized protein LOC105363533 n=1 Tax=Ceratosolen solmsi marchali TaxID=326594 RepID=A0AAJ6YK50_9HYME|nr:PREDICTED: uncharacterized protein LOC105363533 [Ceratosolen solmsi marchali]